MKKAQNANAALMALAPVSGAIPRVERPDSGSSTEAEKELLLTRMSLALCRQYIMWPTNGPLPCEKEIACDKSQNCREMAQDVIDYASEFRKD